MIRFPPPLLFRSATLDFASRAYVMGVLNVTSDSFSDGGEFLDPEAALAHAWRLIADGADILDVGGESTRPGAEPVSAAEEKRRVLPIIEQLAREVDVPISIDTYKAEVAEAAVAVGAEMINDISSGQMDPRMFEVAARTKAAIVLSHIQGTPRNMQANPRYDDVVVEVREALQAAAERAMAAGVARVRIVLDPGIGFGKTVAHNLALLSRVDELCVLGYPVLVGPSLKSFIGNVLGEREPSERVNGTAATVAIVVARGANLIRVHDVGMMVDVARVADAVARAA